MTIKAVIFDLDGTITQPYFDFDAIREEIGLRRDGGPVLEAMRSMTAAQRQQAEAILHHHEEEAVAASQLNSGAKETIDELRRRGIRVAVLTRNRKANAEAVAAKHDLRFDAILGREDGPVKPDAFGVEHLCRRFDVEPADTMLVGDYLFDLLCARSAGAVAVLITNRQQNGDFADHADFQIDELGELLGIIDERSEGRPSTEETAHA
jgi:HAD superfamily hydrolase (TIGR01509 family)